MMSVKDSAECRKTGMGIEEIHTKMRMGVPVMLKLVFTEAIECRIENIYGRMPETKSDEWAVKLKGVKDGTIYIASPRQLFEKPKQVEFRKI